MKEAVVMKRNYKKWGMRAGILLLAIGMWGFNDDLFQISKNLDVFASAYKEVNINYVDDINSAKMIKTGLDAMLDQLSKLTALHEQGALTDAEFSAAKAKLLGTG